MNSPAANPGMTSLVSGLRNLHNDCLRPAYRTLAKISEQLRQLYPDYRGELTTLSPTAISEVLNGKRTRPFQPGWLASFVLSCQHSAWRAGAIDNDPGAASLPEWFAALRAAHHACAAADPAEHTDPANPAEHTDLAEHTEDAPPASRPAYVCPPSTVRLTPAQRLRVGCYGQYGQMLIREIQTGDPEAVYRVALLLGTDPAHVDAARALLVQAAAAYHAASIELLDSGQGGPEPAEMARHASNVAAADARFEEARVY
jgi:hypothetical protein